MELKDLIESFFVESFEGLDAMESGLLNLKPGPVPPEAINDIFRAAHSIKGGGGVFGFTRISEFMHGVEALLDELRSDLREATEELLELLLKSVDCVRQMLIACRDQQEMDMASVERIESQLNAMLHSDNAHHETRGEWLITFTPDEDLLAKANDPLRMFKELAGMGDLRSEARLGALPDFQALDPKKCYLSWELKLQTAATEEAITEVFSWVLDECKLEVAPHTPRQSAPSAPPQPPQPAAPTAGPRIGEGQSITPDSIRVSIDKIDKLINLVGELVITQSMLSRLGSITSDKEDFSFGFAQLVRNTRDLQESVLQIRMLPIRFCFNRFPRLVHDMSLKLGKQVNLKLTGEDTELDMIVLEKINGPLIHLVRNSLDHGLETREQRIAAGKPEIGTIELKAYHQGSNILVEVIDDGRGLDLDKILAQAKKQGLVADDEILDPGQITNLIFQPGFSTAENVNDISGRGVGMDVVKRNIHEVGGDVWVQTQSGSGTKITIKLPLTLAILEGQLLRIGSEIYIMPLISIVETLQIIPGNINTLPGGVQVYKLRDQYLPIINLDKTLATGNTPRNDETGLLVAVESERQLYALWVSELLDQQQVVIKSLESNFKSVKGVSGATILGDGTVALILDVMGIVQQFNARQGAHLRKLADIS